MLGTFKRVDEAKRVIVDIETKDPLLKTKGASWVHGLGHITGISIKVDQETAEYYPLRHQDESNYDREAVSSYLHSIPHSAVVVGHYSYYDLGWLFKELGWLHLGGKYRDTLVVSQLFNNSLSSYSLDAMSRYFNIGQKSEIGDPTKIWTLPINTVARYANMDVELTAKLDDKLYKEWDTEACYRECQLVPILVQMKAKGIKIDVEQLDNVQKQLFGKYNETMAEIPEIKNIWANASVATFFRRLGVNYPFTAPTKAHSSGVPSFPSWFLESQPHSKIQSLSRARKLHRLINTFCLGIRSSIADDGRIHPDFFNGRSDHGGTVTGRFSSAHPNVQQIPHRTEEGMLLRSCFLPDNGIWYKFDYKQQEPILMLHYASKLNLPGIEQWKEIYRQPDADFYRPIEQMMGISRQFSKTLSLAFAYNMGYQLLAQRANISEEEARKSIVKFNQTLPWLAKLKEYCQTRASEQGKIRTIGNRHLYFNRQSAYDALNYLCQGGGADQIKQAMLNIYEKMGLVPMLQVHDNLDYDFSEEMFLEKYDDQIEEIMIDAMKLDFPTRVDKQMGHNWQEAE